MRVLLIQPPQWYPVSPYLAVPLLKTQLIRAGFEAKALDLNALFFNDILTDARVAAADASARADLERLSAECEKADVEKLSGYGCRKLCISEELMEYLDSSIE